uniref:Crystaline entomocidal protoxin n=1 Tax=Bacillus thuringiensis TaxID=1428 RepID=A0A1C6ZWD1_BACTU|nr:insecticidal crystal protein 3 [Bacillus thuringiensis]
MNSYQNKNEYEILNASQNNFNMSNRYPRYPLTNNPQNSMKHTNYKDWLAMCENSQHYDVNPAEINSSSVSTALKILGTLVKFIEQIEGIGPVLTALSAILPVLWPPNTPTPERVWNDFMTNAGSLIDQSITNEVRNDANAQMAVVKENLYRYASSFNSWKGTPTNHPDYPKYLAAVIKEFGLVEAQLRSVAAYFSNRVGYELLLLPIYTQVANHHLLLIRDGLIFANEWSLARGGDDLYKEFHRYASMYISHGIKYYNEGLNTLKNRNVPWGTFNDYRREMTIQVLDIMHLFSSYDVRKYPADLKDTTILPQTELTREIYSALLDSPPNKPIAQLEESLTRDVHLFTWLKNVDFWTFNYNIYPDVRYLSANRIGFSYTNSSAIEPSGIYGSTTFGTVLTHQFPLSNVYRISTKDTTDNQVTNIDLNLINGTSALYNSRIEPVPNNLRTTFFGFSSNESRPNQPTIQDYTHILSYIKTDIIGGHRSRVSFAWTHRTVDPNNQILINNITQIPAVKSSLLNAPARVIKGPGHTGGDLVALLNNGTQAGTMQIQCKTGSFTETSRRYGIRMRYAANNAFTVSLSYTLQGGNPIGTTFVTERTFSRTNNIIPTDLKYEEFKYKEYHQIITMTSPQNTIVTINIRQLNPSSNDQLIIDRIEFIPITQSVLDYKEEQNLETAQAVVDNLFTN